MQSQSESEPLNPPPSPSSQQQCLIKDSSSWQLIHTTNIYRLVKNREFEIYEVPKLRRLGCASTSRAISARISPKPGCGVWRVSGYTYIQIKNHYSTIFRGFPGFKYFGLFFRPCSAGFRSTLRSTICVWTRTVLNGFYMVKHVLQACAMAGCATCSHKPLLDMGTVAVVYRMLRRFFVPSVQTLSGAIKQMRTRCNAIIWAMLEGLQCWRLWHENPCFQTKV